MLLRLRASTRKRPTVVIAPRFAAPAPNSQAELLEITPPPLEALPPSSAIACSASFERPKDLWALLAYSTVHGRAVGVRLVAGSLLKVAIADGAGVRWLTARSVLTTDQANEWARTGQFYPRR